MQIHRDLSRLPSFKNAVVTIGSFDGVHAGHQEILKRVNAQAREINGESILITFHPHPRHVVYPNDNSLKLLTTVEEKAELLEEYQLDHMVVVNFTEAFSKQTPDEYIKNFLIEKFHPKKIVIGYDHKFGNKRAGNIDYLKRFENEFGYTVQEISKQAIDDIAISSTKVRRQLTAGDVENATALLNHRFALTGMVVKGKQIGTGIGFPTANIQVEEPHKLIPAVGIYAVLVNVKDKQFQGMLYIGKSLDNEQQSIEVNIFDFDEDIYNQRIQLEFVAFIREDQRFHNVEELRFQLEKDRRVVRFLFNQKSELDA